MSFQEGNKYQSLQPAFQPFIPNQNAAAMYPQKRDYYKQNVPTVRYKRSGATYTDISKGQFKGMQMINAWNKSKKGMITAQVAPYHKSKDKCETTDGVKYKKMIARVYVSWLREKRVIPCLMNEETGRIYLESMDMVISPKGQGYTRKGKHVKGYFGTVKKRKQ